MIAIISGAIRAPCHDRHDIGDDRVDMGIADLPRRGGKNGYGNQPRRWEVVGIGRPDTTKSLSCQGILTSCWGQTQ